MPAWCLNSILTYEVAGETFTAETFIYFEPGPSGGKNLPVD